MLGLCYKLRTSIFCQLQNDLRGKNWVRTFSRVRKDVDALDDRILLPYAQHGDPGIIHGWKSRARKRSETRRLRSAKGYELEDPLL